MPLNLFLDDLLNLLQTKLLAFTLFNLVNDFVPVLNNQMVDVIAVRNAARQGKVKHSNVLTSETAVVQPKSNVIALYVVFRFASLLRDIFNDFENGVPSMFLKCVAEAFKVFALSSGTNKTHEFGGNAALLRSHETSELTFQSANPSDNNCSFSANSCSDNTN